MKRLKILVLILLTLAFTVITICVSSVNAEALSTISDAIIGETPEEIATAIEITDEAQPAEIIEVVETSVEKEEPIIIIVDEVVPEKETIPKTKAELVKASEGNLETISNNQYLDDAEQIKNAEAVYYYLSSYGWSDNAIFAVLGNMEHESSINPGKWQNGGGPGYGLVQWSPGSKKVVRWAEKIGYNPSSLLTQVMYLDILAYSGEGWVSHKKHSQSFYEFSRDNEHDVDWLTASFFYNYEMPGDSTLKIRQKYAREWRDYFSN